jgi:hypothetical protein
MESDAYFHRRWHMMRRHPINRWYLKPHNIGGTVHAWLFE